MYVEYKGGRHMCFSTLPLYSVVALFLDGYVVVPDKDPVLSILVCEFYRSMTTRQARARTYNPSPYILIYL